MPYPELPLHAIRDHDALRQSACAIRHQLGGGSCACVSSGPCRCLLEALDAFHRHLHRHFAIEEQEWSRSGSIDWTSHGRIHALTREHDSIRDRLTAALIALARIQERCGALPADLGREIRSILDDLLRHELSEAGLLQCQILGESHDAPGERPIETPDRLSRFNPDRRARTRGPCDG